MNFLRFCSHHLIISHPTSENERTELRSEREESSKKRARGLDKDS